MILFHKNNVTLNINVFVGEEIHLYISSCIYIGLRHARNHANICGFILITHLSVCTHIAYSMRVSVSKYPQIITWSGTHITHMCTVLIAYCKMKLARYWEYNDLISSVFMIKGETIYRYSIIQLPVPSQRLSAFGWNWIQNFRAGKQALFAFYNPRNKERLELKC